MDEKLSQNSQSLLGNLQSHSSIHCCTPSILYKIVCDQKIEVPVYKVIISNSLLFALEF